MLDSTNSFLSHKYQILFLTVYVCMFFLIKSSIGFSKKVSFSNQWTVEISGDNSVADDIAFKCGLINHGKVFPGENIYLFVHPRLRKRSLKRNLNLSSIIYSHTNVLKATQQVINHRVKRKSGDFNPHSTPNDKYWKQMWYVLPSTHPSMGVKEAWIAGYTGKNISVTVLDDGLDYSHPDLRANYDPASSWDVNGNDFDPTPRSTPDNDFQHGTRCAGVLGAVGNNKLCTIGVAHRAKIGGIRMLDGKVTDAVEAMSLSFNSNYIDIYTSSWGPDDHGNTVDGPGVLTQEAFLRGAKNGRGGKGSIFIWATGNGGRYDDCNCDGYTGSIYTLSISSVSQRRTVPWYTELCSSTLAATYSSDYSGDGKVITTDLNDSCTSSFTGTSASAPMAAGICALALEANNNLTWRDMQHLVVQTAVSNKLIADDWVVNGAGRKVSHAFGFGLMNAYGMVMKARNWNSVPPQLRCVKTVVLDHRNPRVVPANITYIIPFQMRDCDHVADNVIDLSEHVQAELTISIKKRGDLQIHLVSPKGTRSRLLGRRSYDFSNSGFRSWNFMSTHFWDEDPKGVWELEIETQSYTAYLFLFRLKLFGTKLSDWPASQRLEHSKGSAQQSKQNTTFPYSKENNKAPSLVEPPFSVRVPNSNPNKNCKIANPSGQGCLGSNGSPRARFDFVILIFIFLIRCFPSAISRELQ